MKRVIILAAIVPLLSLSCSITSFLPSGNSSQVQTETAQTRTESVSKTKQAAQKALISKVLFEINKDFWVFDKNGMNLRQISHCPDISKANASWSWDGSKIVYEFWACQRSAPRRAYAFRNERF